MDHHSEELLRHMGRPNGLAASSRLPKLLQSLVCRYLEQSAEVIRHRGRSDETGQTLSTLRSWQPRSLSPTSSWMNSMKHSPVHHAISVCRSSLSCIRLMATALCVKILLLSHGGDAPAAFQTLRIHLFLLFTQDCFSHVD